jgi:hypothetical protein
MCFQGHCFNFDDYSSKKVAIFISGPGHLEYPWALETALRLRRQGASVQIYDISEFSLKYSARIRIKNFILPYQSRNLLRKILLSPQSRIENVFARICQQHGISHSYHHSLSRVVYAKKNKQLLIAEYQETYWGPVKASEIIRTVISGRKRKLMNIDDYVDLHSIQELEAAVSETNQFLDVFPLENFDAVFLANGRQPVQATLTINLRKKGKKIILYESGGGAIFPEFLTPHIDYWMTSPANLEETKAKIHCPSFNKCSSESALTRLVNSVKERSQIPFSINYLTKVPEPFDLKTLGRGRNYAFFTTTDWEFSILYDRVVTPTTFRTQFEAVDFLIDSLGTEDKLFIRIHPSDPDLESIPQLDWQKYSLNQKVQVIPSVSRVNSFELARSMDVNFVWSSFIGFELILQNQIVGAFGDAVYADLLGGNWIPTPGKARSFMSGLSRVSSENVIPYAIYLAFGGFEMTSSQVKSSREIFLLGKRVDEFRILLRWIPDRIRIKIS